MIDEEDSALRAGCPDEVTTCTATKKSSEAAWEVLIVRSCCSHSGLIEQLSSLVPGGRGSFRRFCFHRRLNFGRRDFRGGFRARLGNSS